MRPIDVCRGSLAACAAFGVLFMLIGVLLIPVLPHFQLDAVLTPQQLADVSTRENTLDLLTKASGNSWLVWCVAGLLIMFCATVALVASRKVP